MIKVVGLLRRRPGMSREAFREHYERVHRVIGEKYLKGHAVRYVRRYLTPLDAPAPDAAPGPDCDAMWEIWYPDHAAFEAAMARLAEPDAMQEIGEDVARLFDAPARRYYTVDEVESDMGA
jgi:hypothetical protein